MSTRCKIGKINANGSVTTINCDHDGYLEHAGRVLASKYKDPKQLDKLLALGNLCCLGDTPEISTAYTRDHDDKLVKMARNAYPDATFEAKTFKRGLAEVRDAIKTYTPFCYIMAQGSWIVIGGDSGNWEDLDMVLEDLEETA